MKSNEYENFMKLAQELIKVPHSEIKAKLEEEKSQKKIRKRQAKRKT